ncbi:MAG: 1,6-anhydro-N-acetylmuramyl-L-alanine amidase AmpD [Gammaproteobacteria bacterium]|nr:1,6-anhydro-N-acetylmuramyl-L-alanine amidase AmpD [Gammaproteobacteria bacterium]
MYTVTVDHWLRGARRMPSPNASARPDPEDISLVVIHGISLPPGKFGTGRVEALFTNTLDTAVDPSLADLEGVRVSSHLLISRRADVSQFVPFDRCAWHAGVSSHRGRERCNDYSIGIELEGTDDRPYTKLQYDKLVDVLTVLLRHYPRLSLADVVGHSEIAPGRKTDPGPAFDWPRLYRALGR